MAAERDYGADQIQILEGLEAVRKRPGMYIGSTSSRGLHHLVYEIVDNSVDEALAGFCSEIQVFINEDNSISVVDNGRGIPVDIQKKAGRPAVEVVFTVLHAGGKFGGGGYKVSGGLHGVGSSVVNALSTWLEVEVSRNGHIYKQRYERGHVCNDLEIIGDTEKTGTKVTFKPDGEIFDSLIYDYETLKVRLRETAFLTKGLKIVLTDLRHPDQKIDTMSTSSAMEAVDAEDAMDAEGITEKSQLEAIAEEKKNAAENDAEARALLEEINQKGSVDGENAEKKFKPRTETFYYEGGIKEFVSYLNKHKTPLYDKVIYCEGSKDDVYVEVALQHNDSFNETVYSFVNNIITPEGGMHLTGFRSAITKVFNDYARKNGILKEKDDNLSGEDLREGLTAIISIKIEDPQFEGQTKQKLGNAVARTAVDNVMSEQLVYFLEQNPDVAGTIVNKAVLAQKARIAARKARDVARKTNLTDNMSLPGKLADCSDKNPKNCEIYIVEGDSAGGSAKTARNRATQAILPLRGKILNVEKARIDHILENKEIQAMITAFGTGIHENFDISKLRYDKIIIMTDADVDGAHIATLLLTFFYRFMPDLIRQGHVYLAQPPLYRLEKNKNFWYAYSDEELANIINEVGRDQNNKVQRYKGLGEMDAEQLWDTTMDPEKRLLLRVSLDGDDESEVDVTFNVLMGDKVEPRKKFIEDNAKFVKNLDV